MSKKPKKDGRKTAKIKPPKEHGPKTQRELSELLGVSPALVNYHIKKGNAPPVDDVGAWLEFLSVNGREGSLPEDLRRNIGLARQRLIEAQATRVERENRIAARELMPREEFITAVQQGTGAYYGALNRVLNEMPPTLVGLDELGIRAKLQAGIEEIKDTLRAVFNMWAGQNVENTPEFQQGQQGVASAAVVRAVSERTAAEGVEHEYQTFRRWLTEEEKIRSEKRAEWCRLRAAAGLPVPDATDEELRAFPGLRRA